MPKVTFDPEHKQENPFDYPKLNLDKAERARVLVIEKEPEYEWVHVMRAPQVINGKVQMEMVRGRGGEDEERPKYDFIGRHICIGDLTRLGEKGVDEDNCPVCRASTQGDAVRPPERRFAMHIIRYGIKSGSFEVQEPFSVQCQAWVFGDRLFTQLVDFAQEWGNLHNHDLLLGPCENKQFQKFDIAVANKAEWQGSEDKKMLVVNTFKENKSLDLSKLIGRKLTREQIEDDLERVLRRNRQAWGGPATEDTQQELGAAMDLEGLLDGPKTEEPVAAAPETPAPAPEPPAEPEAPAEPEVPVAEAPAEPEAAKEEEKPAEQPANGSGVEDFDALLEQI